jgi:hypothetical protein
VQRATSFALLAASFLLAGTMQAQRGGGAFQGGTARIGGPTLGGRPGIRLGSSRLHKLRDAAIYYPFFSGEYDEPYEYQQVSPALMVMQPDTRPTPELPAAGPKVIDLPGAMSSASVKPQPPATFVLRNGERLESRRYLLTHDSLYLTIDRQQRTIPLAMLDINATVAADHERGIDLRIPADRSEISLSF